MRAEDLVREVRSVADQATRDRVVRELGDGLEILDALAVGERVDEIAEVVDARGLVDRDGEARRRETAQA